MATQFEDCSLFRYFCDLRQDRPRAGTQLVDFAFAAIASAMIDGIYAVHYTLDMRNVAIAFAAMLIHSNALAAGPSPYAPKRPGDLQSAVVQLSSVPCTADTAFGVWLLAPSAVSKVQVIKRQRTYEQGPFVAEFSPDAAYPPFTEFDLTETVKSEVVWQVSGEAHFRTDELAYEQTLQLKAFYEARTGGKWVQRKGFPSPRIGSVSIYLPLSGFSIDLSLDRNRLRLTCRSHQGTVDAMREAGLAR